MLSKFGKKSIQKSLIFLSKANYARGLFAFVLLPFILNASSILDILKIQPSLLSVDYVNNKQQFQLHTLMTEQRHPHTWDLSQRIKENTCDGIERLLRVDCDISEMFLHLASNTHLLEQAASAIKEAIVENKKIYIYGCGATGRLAKQMESSFWRPIWKKIESYPQWKKIQNDLPGIENRLIGEMTGGDRALISSLEGFEDLQLIGKLQLEDHGIQKGDVVFAITEGGETSSVIGTILAAANQYKESDPLAEKQHHLYFIYNNPDCVLLPFDRSRSVLDNEAITKMCLATGPQSITGSTRMQATTSETFVMGIILEQALYELLNPYFSEDELNQLELTDATMKERLLSFLPVQQTVYAAQTSISKLTDLEASTYSKGSSSFYFASDGLITVFIDSTERAPTFRLFPLDPCTSKEKKSWIQVWTPAIDKHSAWNSFLGRDFRGLNKEFYEYSFSKNIDDPYLRQAALTSLSKAGDDQKNLFDFSFSKENLERNGPKENDLGVMILFPNEIAQLNDCTSPFQSWLRTLSSIEKVNIAVILVPTVLLSQSDPAIETILKIAPESLILQLPMHPLYDPLQLRRHMGVKMVLNAHSTAVMAKLGRVVGNTMTFVNPGNLKLIGRATSLILSHVNDQLSIDEKITYSDANAALFDALEYGKRTQKIGQNSEVGLCIIRILETIKNQSYCSWEQAEDLLQTIGLENYLY